MKRRRQQPGATRSTSILLAVFVAFSGLSCGRMGSTTASSDPDATPSVAAPATRPEERTAAVVTTGCGSAPAAIGSAVRLDDKVLLTAGHVVVGSGSVAVLDATALPAERQWPDFAPAALLGQAAKASILAFDPNRDLALISAGEAQDGGDLPRPELAVVGPDTAVEIHGVAAPGPISGAVAERTTIVTEEVRGVERVRRDGYRLEATTTGGDSGAGVWSADGRLVGLVFAVSSADDSRTWAVSGAEIEAFLADVHAGPPRSFRCDETDSRIVADG